MRKFYGLVAVGVMLMLAGCGNKQSTGTTTTSTSTEKKVSLVKQSHTNGTFVWLQVNNIAKDGMVSAVNVLHNGKMTTYQIFDNDVTLGKLSKLSDSAVIELAKKQDKKYATTGAESEIKHWLDGNDQQVGQEGDFDQDAKDAALGRTEIYYAWDTNDNEHISDDPESSNTISAKKFYKELPDDYAEPKNNDGVDNTDLYDFTPSGTKGLIIKDYVVKGDGNYAKALLKSISDSKYQAPVARSIKVKNTTDASGNHLTSQAVTYQAIDFFDGSAQKDNVFKLIDQNKSEFLAMLSNGINRTTAGNDGNSAAIKFWNAKYITQYNQLIKPNYSTLMKNVYGYHRFGHTMTLSNRLSQKIYKSRYIGYFVSDRHNYIVTKAQNSKQKAVLAK